MRIFLFSVSVFSVLQWVNPPKKVLQEYSGGAKNLYSNYLQLYADSTYFLKTLNHNGADITRDSGQWIKMGNYLVLTSTGTESKHTHTLSRKERKRKKTEERYEYTYSNFQMYKQDSFLLRNDTLFLFNFKKLSNKHDSDFNFLWHTLRLRKN